MSDWTLFECSLTCLKNTLPFRIFKYVKLYLRHQEIKCALFVSENGLFNWMCYLLAAITVMLRCMDGNREQIKEEECSAFLSLTCSCLWSLLCFLRVTWLRRDWQRHDSSGKQKVLHVHGEMSTEWVFEKNKSQLAVEAWCPEPHLNWITVASLMMQCVSSCHKTWFRYK